MLLKYFGIVFALSWALWFAADAISSPVLRGFLYFIGVFIPGIASLAFTYREQGSHALRSLLQRLVKVDVGARWFAFALFFMFVVKLLVAGIIRISSGAWPAFGNEPVPLMFGAAIISTVIGGQAGEELGWRGYALPRMARTMGLGPASLQLGLIWALWHLPFFYILGGDKAGQSFPFYLLQVMATSVAVAWLYMKTSGSLLVTMLFHAAVNNTKDIVPSALAQPGDPWLLRASPVGWLTLTTLWLCAAWFMYDMRRDTTVSELAEAS